MNFFYKNFIKSTFLIIILIMSQYSYAERNTGIGLILGEPTGVSVEHYLDKNASIDGALAWSFSRETEFHIHSDYLLHKRSTLKINGKHLGLFYGAGIRLKAEKKSRLGVRLPVGLHYYLQEAPIKFFGEIAPIVDLIPDTELAINIGIGLRWYL